MANYACGGSQGRRSQAGTRKPQREGLKHDQAHGRANDGAAKGLSNEAGWHENLSRVTLVL